MLHKPECTPGAPGSRTTRRQPSRGLLALLYFCAALALSLVLALALHNDSTYHTGSWDDYSEALVFGRMLQMQQDQSAPGGFMGVYTEDWGGEQNRYLYRDNTPVDPAQYHSYTHQSGLQGWALGAANKVFSVFVPDGTARESRLYLLNSVLFYMAALTVGWSLGRRFGWLTGLGWCAALAAAPWLQTGMKDLYWCLWLWLLPPLAGIALCAGTAGAGEAAGTPRWGYLLVFLACLLRCLCGFEFVSAYLILCEAPLVAAWAAPGLGAAGRRRWLGRMAGAGVAGVGGLAAALCVWLVQGRLYFGGWGQSLQNMLGAAGSRMSMSDDTVRAGVTVPGVLYKYIVADATVVLRAGRWQIALWPLLLATLAALAASALLLAALHRTALLRGLAPAAAVWGLAFLAPVSWMVLSKAHADIHTQLMPMLWQFAFVPGCCALWALLLQTLVRAFLPAAAKQ